MEQNRDLTDADVSTNATQRLQEAEGQDHEARLEALDGLYRDLEAELEAAGSQALQQ